MKITAEAIYERGVFRLLEPVAMSEGQIVELEITALDAGGDLAEAWQRIARRREEQFRRRGEPGDAAATSREDQEGG